MYHALGISGLILLYIMPISSTDGFECSTICTLEDGKRTVGDENTDPPRMKFKRITTSVTLMGSLSLNCRLCHSNPASTIEWFFNGKPLQFQGQRMHITSTPCQETLFLLVVLSEDEGDYTCVARNRFGETNSTTEVRIIDKGCSRDCILADDGRRKVGNKELGLPRMKFEWFQRLAMINSMVEITCSLCESNPPSTLTWFYNGAQLDLNRHGMQVISSCSKESLYFRVSEKNGGNYTCVANNALGEARSTTEISPLHSVQPPRKIAISLQTKSGTMNGNLKSIKIGSPLNITCIVQHTPCGDQNRWLWKRNGKIIAQNNTEYKQEHERCKSRLMVKEVVKNNEGHYQCSLGYSKNTISLTAVPCFRGFYCPSIAQKAVRCPNGTFSMHQNATNRNQCDPCPTDGRNETLSALRDRKPEIVQIFEENCPYSSTAKISDTDSGLSQGKIVAIAACLSGVVLVIVLIILYLMRKCHPYKRIVRPPLTDMQIELPDVPQSKDVFVCYSSKNQEWVHGTLLSNLRAQNFETFIDFKDFEIGLTIHQNIVNGIYGSRKTIFVLSKDSLRSYYARTELGQALAASCRTRHQVIVILYEKCKVPDEISDIVYLDWTDEEKRYHFWEKLYDAIRAPLENEVETL